MSRLFDDGSSEYLGYAGAVVAGPPLVMACWFNSDDDAASQRLMTINDTDARNCYRLANRGNVGGDPIEVVTIQADGDFSVSQSTAGFTAGTWHHACGIIADTDDHRILLDGGNKATDATDITVINLDNTRIGCEDRNEGGPGSFYSGLIAEAAIWDLSNWPGATNSDKADNFERIVLSLAKGFTPDNYPLGLVAYWPLIRGLTDKFGRYNLTASGTIVAAHPRIIQPCGVL